MVYIIYLFGTKVLIVGSIVDDASRKALSSRKFASATMAMKKKMI